MLSVCLSENIRTVAPAGLCLSVLPASHLPSASELLPLASACWYSSWVFQIHASYIHAVSKKPWAVLYELVFTLTLTLTLFLFQQPQYWNPYRQAQITCSASRASINDPTCPATQEPLDMSQVQDLVAANPLAYRIWSSIRVKCTNLGCH